MKRLKIFALVGAVVLLQSCVTNRKILRTLERWKSTQDSILSTNHLFFNYEKSRIDTTYKNISDPDLLRRFNHLAKPKNKR